MKILIYSSATTRARYVLEGSVATIDANIAGIQPGMAHLDISADTEAPTENLSSYRVLDGALVYDPPPSMLHRIDPATGNWIDPRTLADLKALKNAEINAARLAANRGTFTFMGKQISCDELSRSDIDGLNGIVSLLGAMPPDWIGFWKTADNDYIAIPDVATWTGLYGAMVAQGQANFARSQALKAALAAAATAAEVEAIAW